MPTASPRKLPERVDVAIVGAGTAGAAVGAFCAERGLRVLCLDRRPLTKAGARWCNGVPGWAFDEAGVARPAGEELRGANVPFHLIAGQGPSRVVIRDHGVLEVDMRHLVARLHDRARAANAVLAGQIGVNSLERGTLRTSSGSVRAEWIIDASGDSGLRLLGQPRVASDHLCAASQQVCRIVSPNAAADYFNTHGVAPGEVLCFTGLAGGFSVLNLRADARCEHVSILAGSIPAAGHAPGKVMLDQFVGSQPWIGESLFGGAGTIPLRRPFDCIANDRVALVGEAACQVFSAHGSGIGTGLVAARLLANSLADGAGLRSYGTTWHRSWGGLLASFDLLRRFSQSISLPQLTRMMECGLIDPQLSRRGLAQQFPQFPPLSTLPTKAAALVRAPYLASRLAAVVTRMAAIRLLYARYPSQPSALPRWSNAVARVFCEPPDASRIIT